MEPGIGLIRHDSRRMRGRDPHETHRTATPLELLFDLTFATSFGLAASDAASVLADGHVIAGLVGFGFASLAICWAWINFSWFSSAYDTDDWLFRVVTMVQMIGVLVLAAGVPRMFASIERTGRLDNSVMVLGYVIMRVALVFQWLRAATDNRARRRVCLTYAATISIAQVGWVVQIVAPFAASSAIILGSILVLIELAGPVLAERQAGGTPWHAHHIAERHSLFAIIALGEGVVGTVAALSAVVDRQGWTLDAVLTGIAGMGLTFGMWWVYFLVPSGEILQRHRNRAPVWGYVQMLVVTSIVATGAGLRVAANFIEGRATITAIAAVLAVVVPVGVFLLLMYALSYYLVRRFYVFQAWLLIGTAGAIAATLVAGLSGVDVAKCLVILMLAPAVTVVGSEVRVANTSSP
ncbi:MAG TPA: low temperature requirement protein A [Vicinamibacterales bacterium]|jgi:low temperature requirement protein LtrA|nr:low temperature requirement protein A [Vicinamibacterales bacterium]